MFLIEDIIGAASRIIYGRKGDIVTIIRTGHDLTLVELNNQKFFVRNEKLSKEKVDPDPEVDKENTNRVQRLGSKSRRGSRLR
jgi:hypothetical protein